MTDTPTLLVELERLLAEATPGPYEARKWGSRYRIIERAQGLTVAHVPVEYMTPAREVADLIVAAVNALPTLVSALRQSQEREAGMREALREARAEVRETLTDLLHARSENVLDSAHPRFDAEAAKEIGRLEAVLARIDAALSTTPSMEPNDGHKIS